MKRFLFLNFLLACILLCYNTNAQFSKAGDLDTTFNFGRPHHLFTNPTNPQPGEGASSTVRVIIHQPDNKVIIGGNFTSYNGKACNRITRLNTDGSLDTTFNPGTGTNEEVSAIILQPDGKVFVGGQFTSYNGIIRNYIARLNIDGSLDTTFNPGIGANSYVNTINLQPDGKVLIGGYLTSYNNIIRNRIARLNADGSLDTTFNPGIGANSWINSLTLQPDGKVIIGGNFTSYNGKLRNYIARLNTNGSLDNTFNLDSTTNSTVGTVTSLVLQPDGKVILNDVIRLNADGSLDTTFNPDSGINDTVWFLVLQPDGKVLIGGDFTSYNSTPRNRIARLNADGSLDNTFNPKIGANSRIYSIALQPDGKVLIGGTFFSYNGTTRSRITRLNADGSLDNTFNPKIGADEQVCSIVLQLDGKILVGGQFTNYNDTACKGIARLNADGSLDNTFNPGSGADDIVRSIILQPNGKVLIGGDFTTYNGTARSRIARLNADGSLDVTFNPGSGTAGAIITSINSLTLQSNGKVLIGGDFTTYNGTARSRIARLNADGSLDTTFNPGSGADNRISSITLQPNGKILIGGEFSSYNGTARSRIARLNPDGSLDTTFNPSSGVDNRVSSIILQLDGKILIGREFRSYNGTARSRIARLNADGSLETTFNPGSGADNLVNSIILQPNGKILIGGRFSNYNGTARSRIARLNADGSLDTTFNPGSGAAGGIITSINSLTLQSNSKVLVGGDFTTYNGIYRPQILRMF